MTSYFGDFLKTVCKFLTRNYFLEVDFSGEVQGLYLTKHDLNCLCGLDKLTAG